MSLLVDPVAGWLGGLLGDSLVGLLRRSPEERMLHTATGAAVEKVLARVEEDSREAVRQGLRVCFSRPPVVGLEGSLPVEQAVRAAVAAQVALLGEMVANEPGGRRFFDTVRVGEQWLAEQLAEALLTGLRQSVAASGVSELVRAWEGEQVRASLDELRDLLERVAACAGPPAQGSTRVLVGVIPQAAECLQPRQVSAGLAETLAEGGTAVLAGVLTGMGGVGKTQLAAAYTRTAWQDGEAEVVVWVAASSRPGIIAAYADAAARLGLTTAAGEGGDLEEAAGRFLEWAQTAGRRWLVVLDDIQDPSDVRGLWPAAGGANRVLATTRRRDAALAGQGRRVVEVDLFTSAEARSYLRAKLAAHGRTDTPEQIDGLAADLGLLPLALAQAAAYLIDAAVGCAAYRGLLADRRRRLHQMVPEPGSLPDDHHHIVAAAWSLSVERANQARPAGLARALLQLASVLDPNGIPEAVLTGPPAHTYLTLNRHPTPAPDAAGLDGARVREGLRVLHRFSLITHDPHAVHRQVRVHQLIQRATRETLTGDQLTQAAHTAADAVLAVWPQIERDRPTQQLGALVRANTAALHTSTGAALWRYNGQAHPVLFRAASSLGDTGQVTAAHTAYAELCTTAHQLLGADHPDTLTTRNNLAYWRGAAGDAAGAAAAFEELLADSLRVLGADHPDTLATRGNLADWRGAAGDAAGAATAFEELLADALRVLGADHPDTLTTRHNLARWRGEAGDAAGAAAAFEELLADYLRVLGADHPDTLTTRHNLAYWRGEAGDAAGAATALEELLADRLRVLGADHPDTLTTRNNLAYWRDRAGLA